MIEKYSSKDFLSVYDFLRSNRNSDFYITFDNRRFFVNSLADLKKFLKSMRSVYLILERGDCLGLICLWHSCGITETGVKIERDYVKVNAVNVNIARDLLSVLLWNYGQKDLYVKLKANSQFVRVFAEKKFHVFRDREAITAFKTGQKTPLNSSREIIYKRERFIVPLKVEINKD